MATLWRILGRGRPGIQALLSKHGQKCTVCRHIATSEKRKEIVTSPALSDADKTRELKELEEHFADADPDKLKNWVTHGWSKVNREDDDWTHNFIMFMLYSVMLCGTIFTVYSLPDMKGLDWALREAYFDMEKREKAGLPLIDPYTVPPEQIELPDEEDIDIDIHV